METVEQVTFDNIIVRLEEEAFSPTDRSIDILSSDKAVILAKLKEWIQSLVDQSDYFDDDQDDLKELEELALRYQRGVCNPTDYEDLLFHLYQISL